MSLRCEVVAVGTELLLGQVVDTNSSWIGEQLALAGIDSHFQTKVGDNRARIVSVLRLALDRSDAVIVCGGLGPTHDDITRECIAEVMGVELERHDDIAERITQMFASRGRRMAENNLRQADVPDGATVIPQVRGTAPGLICPVGEKVVYAVPGVPHEMKEMLARAIIPDLRERSGETAVIASRTLRTWGESESGLAETLAPLIARLDETGNPTLAFLASGIEGLKVRLTAKAGSEAGAAELLAVEERMVRDILGSLVFGVDDETMESAVLDLLRRQARSLALAESVTGGLVAARLTSVPGASDVFKGSVVSYATEVKHDILGVPGGPVVSEVAARAMAEGACRVMDADVGLALTGVAGPTEQDGQPVGTLYVGLCIDGDTETVHLRLPG
ncbi:MAG TPA: competence/damage-inducible protein A, partial [Acidimicrobiales bacterium]|nr:competence/damage-inducible protein A [Acidimicrobiales bacterium]